MKANAFFVEMDLHFSMNFLPPVGICFEGAAVVSLDECLEVFEGVQLRFLLFLLENCRIACVKLPSQRLLIYFTVRVFSPNQSTLQQALFLSMFMSTRHASGQETGDASCLWRSASDHKGPKWRHV